MKTEAFQKRTERERRILQLFGHKLRKIREKKGYTQEAMAHFAGLSRSYYAEVETGMRNISLLNITKIMKALNIDLNELIALSDLINISLK